MKKPSRSFTHVITKSKVNSQSLLLPSLRSIFVALFGLPTLQRSKWDYRESFGRPLHVIHLILKANFYALIDYSKRLLMAAYHQDLATTKTPRTSGRVFGDEAPFVAQIYGLAHTRYKRASARHGSKSRD